MLQDSDLKDTQECEQRVLVAIWTKLQKDNILSKDSSYRILASRIVQEANKRGYTKSEVVGMCENFEVNVKLFGDRIELSEFFDSYSLPELKPYAWALEENHNSQGAMARMDSYRIDGKAFFCYCTGKHYPNLDLIACKGQKVDKTV